MELQKSETRKELLENTISYFNSNNRGVMKYTGWSLNKKDMCTFINQETGSRCAIGRELPEKLAVYIDENFNGSVSYTSVFNKLPERLQAMGSHFLCQIQKLHDSENYWDENGLSIEGLRFVDNIKMKFDID